MFFKNIHYPLGIDKGNGKLTEETLYEDHIKQLIKQVLLTNPGERINRPDFGCGIRQMVFAPNSVVTESLLKVTILQALEEWLGTVIIVEEVEVYSLQEKLEVTVRYTIRALQQRTYLNMEVGL